MRNDMRKGAVLVALTFLSASGGCQQVDGPRGASRRAFAVVAACVRTRCDEPSGEGKSGDSPPPPSGPGARASAAAIGGARAGCSDEDRATCLEHSYRVDLGAPPDERVLEACERAAERDARCGERAVEPSCEHWAGLEDPARSVGAYRCVEELPCGATPTPCLPPPGTLGAEVCAAYDRACAAGPRCNDAFRTFVDAESSWLRDDVAEALRACANAPPSCEDALRCMRAWVDAVWAAAR
jgi:hypothetical protein